MGCIETRIESEENLGLAERRMGFSSVSADFINTIMRKYSYKGKINQAQLQKINSQLKLRIFPLKYSIQVFLNSMRKADHTFSLKEMLVLGILLGAGTNMEKASLIYRVFDEILEDSIEKIRISDEVLMTISRISTDFTPNLVTKDAYFLEMLEKQQKVINSIMEKFPVGVLAMNEKEFIEWMSSLENGSLMTSVGWREYSKKIQK